MKILITNDDGLHAKGIYELVKEISKKHQVTVVAPREQKSASSHSISIHTPIKIRREDIIEGIESYSVVGTPADCTQVGLSLLGKEFDLVISGINRGLNCGTDILYSGTVSAAIEGCIYDLPAIAMSMEVDWLKHDEDYKEAAKWALEILDIAEEKYLKKHVVLNVNVPNLKKEEVKGIKVCKLGKSTYRTEYVLVEENEDKVYEIRSNKNNNLEKDSDIFYLDQGYVTITPLQYDFTNFDLIDTFKEMFE